ncbi:hypothetical protein GCM10008932_07000 [Alkalibacterium iburiense]|uniref:DUF2264 domain-containing protein n=1 Tax=Alkalibacterium iburiense TaxID=290589 RepID=A0ABN0X710_9LACT
MSSLKENPFKTKEDLKHALTQLVDPMETYYSESKARIHTSDTGVGYGKKTAGMETLLRLLWGMAPLAAGGQTHKQLSSIKEGIVNGTNPKHADYWGGP